MRAYLSISRSFVSALLLLGVIALAATASAAPNDLFDRASGLERAPASSAPNAAYTESAGSLTPRQMVQQKAQIRAAQRMSRIAAAEWFGHSVARPRTNATPFSGIYGTQFQGRTYGRPAAFHSVRPMVVVTR